MAEFLVWDEIVDIIEIYEVVTKQYVVDQFVQISHSSSNRSQLLSDNVSLNFEGFCDIMQRLESKTSVPDEKDVDDDVVELDVSDMADKDSSLNQLENQHRNQLRSAFNILCVQRPNYLMLNEFLVWKHMLLTSFSNCQNH